MFCHKFWSIVKYSYWHTSSIIELLYESYNSVIQSILDGVMACYLLMLEEQSIIVGMSTSRSSLSQISNVVGRSKKTIVLT